MTPKPALPSSGRRPGLRHPAIVNAAIRRSMTARSLFAMH